MLNQRRTSMVVKQRRTLLSFSSVILFIMVNGLYVSTLLCKKSNGYARSSVTSFATVVRQDYVRSISKIPTTPCKVNSFLETGKLNPSSICMRPVLLSRRFMSSVATRTPSVVESFEEDELDAALDDLLGSTLDKAKIPVSNVRLVPERKISVKSTQTKADNKLKESDFDFTDPEFLRTTNPRWIEAGLSQNVIDILSAKGITHFTPVQGEAFEQIMNRRDVIGRSRTGTGKTLAFGMPSLTRLVQFTEEVGKRDPETGRMKKGRSPSMIILCPTRELARQVQEELSSIAKPLGLFVDVVHGGVSYEPQSRSLSQGIDCLVGTPGRIIDHIERGNLKLNSCDVVVLDEADEMLNMGFAEDVETILNGVGSDNPHKTQCLLFSATTPSWVKDIGKQYQSNVYSIDSTTGEGGARVATTVRHTAIQVPPGEESKKAILEDIIAVEISRDAIDDLDSGIIDESNPIAAAAAARKRNSTNAMQQKIFGKTIVFTETKRQADELVSGSVFKCLSAQALHGDVGQKQRDATLAAFRAGAFNVLVATDVAARGIDIQDVDLVIQFDPPRDVDTYVHRSGRTGRAGKKGVSVLLFNSRQSRDIVRIERDLGHEFKFVLSGPPSAETTLRAVAKTSAIATKTIPDKVAQYFHEAASMLLAETVMSNPDNNEGADVETVVDPVAVVARCLAAISRRGGSDVIQIRSLITGELGMATVQMSNRRSQSLTANDVMFTVGKLSRMSQSNEELAFESDVGKMQVDSNNNVVLFDMSLQDAEKLISFSKDIDAGGSTFQILKELEVERDRNFGKGQGERGSDRFRGRNVGSNSGGSYDSRAKGRSGYVSKSDYSNTGRSNRGSGYEGNRSERGDGNSRFGGARNSYSSGGRFGGGGSSSGGSSSGNQRRYDSRPSGPSAPRRRSETGGEGW